MTKEHLKKVYEVLVKFGRASALDERSFIDAHMNGSCSEWRFCGHFGFGGKYRVGRNAADYYPEDKTPQREELLARLNEELANLDAELDQIADQKIESMLMDMEPLDES